MSILQSWNVTTFFRNAESFFNVFDIIMTWISHTYHHAADIVFLYFVYNTSLDGLAVDAQAFCFTGTNHLLKQVKCLLKHNKALKA